MQCFAQQKTLQQTLQQTLQSLLSAKHMCLKLPPLHPLAVNVLRYMINPLMSWVVMHGELDVLAPDVVHSLVMNVFHNPEKGAGGQVGKCTDLNFYSIPFSNLPKCALLGYSPEQAAPASRSRWSWSSCAPPSSSTPTLSFRSTEKSSFSLDGESACAGGWVFLGGAGGREVWIF